MRYSCLSVFLCFLSLSLPFISFAENGERSDATFVGRFTQWVWEFDPDTQPYPEYVADPRRPRMAVGLGIIDSSISETSSGRIVLDAGTRYTLFNVKTDPEGVDEFALDIEGAILSQFDPGNKLDVIGWDGVFGLLAVYDWDDQLNIRIGYRHLSAHLGDEYVENTGRKRINYTRDALVFGLAWEFENGFNAYIEPGWAWGLGNEDLQDRWAISGGMQYQSPFNYWNGSAAYFYGGHIDSFQESDWDLDVNAVAGFLIKRDQRSSNIRVQLEFYRGRPVLGEFAFDDDETSLNAGVVFDFY
jgi:hypothetical protein